MRWLPAKVDRAVDSGFVKPSNRDLITVTGDAGALLDALAFPLEESEPKWIRPSDV